MLARMPLRHCKEFALTHIPVLLQAVSRLAVFSVSHPVVVDATLGGAGHAALLVERMAGRGFFIGLDRDPAAIDRARTRLAAASCRVELRHTAFSGIADVLAELGVSLVDFVLADLGVSSFQLDEGHRGFSFSQEGPLDMRMDPTQGESLLQKLETVREEQLAGILRRYGEEPHAGRVARAILRALDEKRINGTADLASVVARAIPHAASLRHHPATRTFQALRIWVNDELGEVERLLAVVPGLLAPGGRMAVISFHSLEDRLVKTAFSALCHPERAIPSWIPLSKDQLPQSAFEMEGPIFPDEAEILENERSRSARMRVLRRKEAS